MIKIIILIIIIVLILIYYNINNKEKVEEGYKNLDNGLKSICYNYKNLTGDEQSECVNSLLELYNGTYIFNMTINQISQPLKFNSCESYNTCNKCFEASLAKGPLSDNTCVWSPSTNKCYNYEKNSGKYPVNDVEGPYEKLPGGNKCTYILPKGSWWKSAKNKDKYGNGTYIKNGVFYTLLNDGNWFENEFGNPWKKASAPYSPRIWYENYFGKLKKIGEDLPPNTRFLKVKGYFQGYDYVPFFEDMNTNTIYKVPTCKMCGRNACLIGEVSNKSYIDSKKYGGEFSCELIENLNKKYIDHEGVQKQNKVLSQNNLENKTFLEIKLEGIDEKNNAYGKIFIKSKENKLEWDVRSVGFDLLIGKGTGIVSNSEIIINLVDNKFPLPQIKVNVKSTDGKTIENLEEVCGNDIGNKLCSLCGPDSTNTDAVCTKIDIHKGNISHELLMGLTKLDPKLGIGMPKLI